MAKVLLLGDPTSSSQLVSQICSYDRLCEGTVDTAHLTEVERVSSGSGYTVNTSISNKYFTAQLQLCVYGTTALESMSSAEREELMNNAEGILLVLPHTREFALDGPLATVGAKAAEAECPVRLLTIEKSEASIPEEVMGWALDNNYECIQMDWDNPTAGWNEREKEGLPRLMEALQSNMWSTMVKNANSSQPFTLRSPAAMNSLATRVSGPSSSSTSSLPTPPPDNTKTRPEQTEAESASASSASASASLSTSASTSQQTNTDKEGVSKPKDDDVESMDKFSDMMDQARMIRDDAANGGLSDAERRRRAADMAMKLSAMMNLDESDDGEDDD